MCGGPRKHVTQTTLELAQRAMRHEFVGPFGPDWSRKYQMWRPLTLRTSLRDVPSNVATNRRQQEHEP